jgi:hypothetical protein
MDGVVLGRPLDYDASRAHFTLLDSFVRTRLANAINLHPTHHDHHLPRRRH